MPHIRTSRFGAAALIAALLAGTVLPATASTASFTPADYDAFVADISKRHGFDAVQLRRQLGSLKVRDDILNAIANPAEAKPWSAYRPIFVNEARIRDGVEFWAANEALLERAERAFGVPAHVIVAILGVETRYGRHKGAYPVMEALATLAFRYPPRADFFRSELEHFFLLTREERLDPLALNGSYAGAMGQSQFISSSYRHYAIDFDNDGVRDLVGSVPDAVGSIANYFVKHGWRTGELVTLPARAHDGQHDRFVAKGRDPRFPVSELRAAGIQIEANVPGEMVGALHRLDGESGPEFWVGLHNFGVIMRYNRSVLYAMAVHQLGNEIALRRANRESR